MCHVPSLLSMIFILNPCWEYGLQSILGVASRVFFKTLKVIILVHSNVHTGQVLDFLYLPCDLSRISLLTTLEPNMRFISASASKYLVSTDKDCLNSTAALVPAADCVVPLPVYPFVSFCNSWSNSSKVISPTSDFLEGVAGDEGWLSAFKTF